MAKAVTAGKKSGVASKARSADKAVGKTVGKAAKAGKKKPKSSATSKTAPKAPAKTRAPAKPRAAAKKPAPSGNGLPPVGRKAPDFSLPADDGRVVGLRNFAGRKLVLYFYPKDDTPGCTVEAIAFSARKAAFEAAGATVVGVSKDPVAAHCRFKAKHDLSIPLLSDESGEMLERYGVWVEKRLYGRTYMGINRATFLIDATGIVRHVWPRVRVQGHADEVLAAVKSL